MVSALKHDLADIRVLVTRPDPAGSVLCDQIRSRGGEAILLPSIAFAPPVDRQELEHAIEVIGEQDWLVFVSPRAVYASIPAIRSRWPVLPSHVKFAAIGPGTAEALRDAGYKVEAHPETEWNSEAFVELPVFQQATGKKIAIIRGEGGREVLEKLLGELGAQLMSVVAYRRVLPVISEGHDLAKLVRSSIDVMVCASYEAVKNLKLMMGDAAWPDLKMIPLIVISERIKVLARILGFQTIWLADNAGHEAILRCLSEKKDEICQIKAMRL